MNSSRVKTVPRRQPEPNTSMSFSFPIPDWGDEAFHYPGVNINGDTNVKKNSKNKKRKHDGDGTLEKDQPENSESAQQASKKKKTDKIEKGKKKSQTSEISSHQDGNSSHASELQATVDTNLLGSKRKKNRKNNKYKELNKKQKDERIAKAGSAGDKSVESNQQDMMTMKCKQVFQTIPSKEETQREQTKEFKKKKKNKWFLEHTRRSVSQEDNIVTQNNSQDTSQNANQNLKLVNSHVKKTNSHDSPATDVGVKKKKKSTNKHSDTILSNSNETQSCLDSNNHQNASNGNIKKKKGIKAGKIGEGNSLKKKDSIGSSVSIHKSKQVNAEDRTKKKKKKKENNNLLKDKENVSKSKKSKLDKQKKGGKSSKKVKGSDDEEELVFDGDEECSEDFDKDLGALLSSLNFSQLKTPGSGKETCYDDNDGDDDDDGDDDGGDDDGDNDITEIGMNNAKEMPQPKKRKDSMDSERKDERKNKRLKKKREKMESAKTNHKKISNGQDSIDRQTPEAPVKKVAKFNREKVAKLLEEAERIQREKPSPPEPPVTLKQKMEGRLMAARFRMINEELYTKRSNEAHQLFKKDPTAFDVYHKGYQAQVRQWPVNPLDFIVNWLSKKPKEWVVADMGCGEATLAQRVPQTCVHSLDLVAANPRVTACDMAYTPLATASVNVVVFCLSLMGTNLKDFMVETNRVLKTDGIMKIAEVESRFGDVKEFEKHLAKYGFHCTARDTSQKYFFLFDFKKTHKVKKTATLPDISLKPCLYKKR